MQSFNKLNCFVLIVGNARSGSTLLGSIINAHPNAMVANETSASANFWRRLSRNDILEEIYIKSENDASSGRMSEGYDYTIQTNVTGKPDILVMGDKVWNPATLLLHGDFSLLTRLEDLINAPVKIIHAIRNPFDVIATMHHRSKAPIPDRILWYFMHCDAVCAIHDHCQDSLFMDIHHEDLIMTPDVVISDISGFLGVDSDIDHIESCKRVLFGEPKRTRFNVNWNKDDIKDIVHRMSQYRFLQKYAVEDYSELPVGI